MMAFYAAGLSYLQPGNAYGTNAAGIVVVPGTAPVGQFRVDPSSNFTYGSLLITISGLGSRQVFASSNANGFDSGDPPTNVFFSDTFESLLGTFSINDPQITFQVFDSGFIGSGGGFALTQYAVPEPSSRAMALAGMACGGWSMWRRKRRHLGGTNVTAAALALRASIA